MLLGRGGWQIDPVLYIMDMSDSVLVPITGRTCDHNANWSDRSDVIIFMQNLNPDRSESNNKLFMININQLFNPQVLTDLNAHFWADLYFNE